MSFLGCILCIQITYFHASFGSLLFLPVAKLYTLEDEIIGGIICE